MVLLLGFTRLMGGIVVVDVVDPDTSITTAEPEMSVAVGAAATFLAFLPAGAAGADAWINRGAS